MKPAEFEFTENPALDNIWHVRYGGENRGYVERITDTRWLAHLYIGKGRHEPLDEFFASRADAALALI